MVLENGATEIVADAACCVTDGCASWPVDMGGGGRGGGFDELPGGWAGP